MSSQIRAARAAECRRLAQHAAGLAQASNLAHVRQKHELAAARWTALAAMDDAVSAARPAGGSSAGRPAVRSAASGRLDDLTLPLLPKAAGM